MTSRPRWISVIFYHADKAMLEKGGLPRSGSDKCKIPLSPLGSDLFQAARPVASRHSNGHVLGL